jgi:hypothetical protein
MVDKSVPRKSRDTYFRTEEVQHYGILQFVKNNLLIRCLDPTNAIVLQMLVLCLMAYF